MLNKYSYYNIHMIRLAAKKLHNFEYDKDQNSFLQSCVALYLESPVTSLRILRKPGIWMSLVSLSLSRCNKGILLPPLPWNILTLKILEKMRMWLVGMRLLVLKFESGDGGLNFLGVFEF